MNTRQVPTLAEVNAGLVALTGKPMSTLICNVSGKEVSYLNGVTVIDTYLEKHDLPMWGADQSELESVVGKFVLENDAFFVPLEKNLGDVEDSFRAAITAGKKLVVFENYGDE